jgi:uncharacterized protein (DUF2141 family)
MKNSMSKFATSILSMSLLGITMMPESATANTTNLTVTVNGLRNQNGQICLSLFSQSEGFPGKSDRAVATQCIAANAASHSAIFQNLNPGQYAVALFHDVNEDSKLNTGIFGIPKEGFGFSQNPRIGTNAPRFEDTAFLLTPQNTQIQIQLKYF